MKTMHFILSILLIILQNILFMPSLAETSQNDQILCIIEEINKDWEQCLDKSVKLQGIHVAPEKVMQHPIMIMQIPQRTEDGSKPRQRQDYLEVGGRQIILLTPVEIPCEDKMEVTGMLKKIALGGKKGTKNEYENWLVEVTDFQCIDAVKD
jgi:hypothetical protein